MYAFIVKRESEIQIKRKLSEKKVSPIGAEFQTFVFNKNFLFQERFN